MIGKNKRYSLPSIIGSDLLYYAKILFLLFAVLISAMLVVTMAHKTRLLTVKREKLMLEHDALNVEWRNLILEENILTDHSRIERIAIERLQMQHVDPIQENIVVSHKVGTTQIS